MDDIFGDIKPKTPIEEAWHKEQERKKYDIIRVKNPTSEDFYVMYDVNQYQKIPANSTIDVPRYIAIRYVQHMHEKIVHDLTQKMHDQFIEERRKKGLPEYRDKATENAETYETSSYPKTNDPEVIAKNMNILWVGLVYEFGRDSLPKKVNPRSGEVDLTPPFMKAVENLGKRRVDAGNSPMYTAQAVPSPYVPQSVQSSVPKVESRFANLNQKLSPSEVTVE